MKKNKIILLQFILVFLCFSISSGAVASEQPRQVICADRSLRIPGTQGPTKLLLDLVYSKDGNRKISHVTLLNIAAMEMIQDIPVAGMAFYSSAPETAPLEVLVNVIDLNFDGVDDFSIETSRGTSNVYKNYWVYSKKGKRYKDIGKYPVLTLSKEQKAITSTERKSINHTEYLSYFWDEEKEQLSASNTYTPAFVTDAESSSVLDETSQELHKPQQMYSNANTLEEEIETWAFQHDKLKIKLYVRDRDVDLLLVTEEQTGRIVYEEIMSWSYGIWGREAVQFYQPLFSSEPSLLTVQQGGGQGTGLYDVIIKVYLIDGKEVVNVYEGQVKSYDAGVWMSYSESEYVHEFSMNSHGQWVMHITGESIQRVCPDGVSSDDCYAMDNGVEEKTVTDKTVVLMRKE